MKVLVGVDGSTNSFAAVEFVGRLLSPKRDQLILLFATPDISLEGELDPGVEQRARSALSRTVLDAALERLPDAWRQQAEPREVAGSPSVSLLNAVKEFGAELVVVGFRGTTTIWEQFILGSVSRAVVYSATVPVLVVKCRPLQSDAALPPTHADADSIRILAASDRSQTAQRISTQISRFTWPANAEGWLMTVVRPLFPFDLPDWIVNQPRDPDIAAMAAAWQQEHEQNVQAARRELEQFRASLPSLFAKHDVVVVEGRPAEQIVEHLRANTIDLAVVGSRGSGRIERLLVGSTAEQVLSSAPCSVLIVR
jgi:nucleotide-binding universal stress UspA family protein